MRVAFVYRGAENLGIEYLSSYLKSRGHETRLFFDPASFSGDRLSRVPLFARFSPDYKKLIAAAVAEWAPDVVAYSAYTASYQWALDVAAHVKSMHPAPTVFGGVHVTAVPRRVLARDVVDAVVVGEGEGALAELVESVDGGKFARFDIPNVGTKKDGEMRINPPRPLIKNLDTLPMPDKEMFFEKSGAFSFAYLAMTGRGCPFKCKYCCNSLYPVLYPNEVHNVRQRSVDSVIRELVPWRNVSRIITFWDDVFPTSAPWLDEFAHRYRREIGLPFMCFVHPSTFTRRVARVLKEAGCIGVKIGIQTISERGGRLLGRVSRVETVKRVAKWLRDEGIFFSMDHMLGLPGETRQDLENTARMYKEIRPIRINSHWLSYFPGVPLLDEAAKRGELTPEEVRDVEEGIGQTTFMLPGDTRSPAAHALMIFDLVPLLPTGWLDFLLRRGRWLRLPYIRLIHQLLLVIQSLKGRDYEIEGFIRYAFGPKKAP